MQAADLKTWLAGVKDDEENGTEGAGDRWRIFVKLVQSIWVTGHIPHQMLHMVIILLPKGDGD